MLDFGNFKDVIENELKNKDDDVLIVQAGSIDITNLKTDRQKVQNVEYFKQQTLSSAKNLFSVVANAEKNNPQLQRWCHREKNHPVWSTSCSCKFRHH